MGVVVGVVHPTHALVRFASFAHSTEQFWDKEPSRRFEGTIGTIGH